MTSGGPCHIYGDIWATDIRRAKAESLIAHSQFIVLQLIFKFVNNRLVLENCV